MAAAATVAPVPLPEPLQFQNSQPGPNPVNTLSNDALAALTILSEATRPRAVDNKPEDKGDFLEICIFLAIMFMLFLVGFRRKQPFGIHNFCSPPRTHGPSLIPDSSQVLIIRTFMGILGAVLHLILLWFLVSSMHSLGTLRHVLFFSGLLIVALYVDSSGIGLSKMFSLQNGPVIVDFVNFVLFAFTVIVLPPDPEIQKKTGPFWKSRHGLTVFWIGVAIVTPSPWRLSHILAMASHMLQPKHMILVVASVVFITALVLSDQAKDNRHVEDVRSVQDELVVVQQSKIWTCIPWICISILSYLWLLVSGAAFRYLWTFTVANMLPFSFLNVLIPMGGGFLVYMMAHSGTLYLVVELEHIFNLRLESFGMNPGRDGNNGAELAYAACPLTAPDSIRVIQLHPGSPNDELHCTLTAVRLGEQPTYEALSYCWGRRASNRYIKFQSSSQSTAAIGNSAPAATLAVTDTLHDALVYLRYPEEKRVLWVDQICINQKDDDERSAQVNLMRDIYSSTSRAIVWLRVGRPGLPAWLVPQKSKLPKFFEEIDTVISKFAEDDALESDPVVGSKTYKVRSKKRIQDMTKDDRAKYGLPEESDQRWTLFYGFFDAPWFSRVWVIQEVAWPREVKIHYTDLETSWEQFTRVINFVESLELSIFNPDKQAVRRFFLRLRALQSSRKSMQAGNAESLDNVLSQHRMAAAEEPLDHIYGLMSLASERPPLLSPNYEASTKDVFLQTAKWAIQEGRLDILGLCGDPSNSNRPEDLPSWVPDFSDGGGPHSLTGMGMLLPCEVNSLKEFSASSGLGPPPQVREDGTMAIMGQPIGEVQEVCAGPAPGRDTLDTHKLHTATQVEDAELHSGEVQREESRMLNTKMVWGRLARKLAAENSEYDHTNESMEDAFLRTYLLGETDEILEKLRPDYKVDLSRLKVWRLLTFGQGCSSQLVFPAIGCVVVLGMLAAGPLLHILYLCGYRFASSPSHYNEYETRRRLSAERGLFCGTDGLIGLAPRWALPGDKIFVLQGGKVPVILRRTRHDSPYRFIGEAYVHGAMHGEMFDLQKCKRILIA